MKIVLSHTAFLVLVTSCVEVYRKESFGLLLGKKRGKSYFIDTALPFQSAKRGYLSAVLPEKKEKLINSVLGCMSKDSIVGDFHSHPGQVYHSLSISDKQDLKKRKKSYMSLLVAIRKSKRYAAWKVNSDMTISGSIGSFFVSFKGYYFDVDSKRILRAKIDFPFLKKINTTYCQVNQEQTA